MQNEGKPEQVKGHEPGGAVPGFITTSDDRGDFVTGPDGCVIFWPDGFPNGGFNAWHLRAIADELDRRNADWFKQMDKAFSTGAALSNTPEGQSNE